MIQCQYCNEEFPKDHNNRRAKYCSKKCCSKATEKANYPPDDQFIKMVDDLGQSAVGRTLGVSGRTIKKRYDKIKIRPL